MVDQWKRQPAANEDPRFRDFVLPTLFGVSFRDQKSGAACGLEGSIIATNDGGKTWSFQKESPKPGAPPTTPFRERRKSPRMIRCSAFSFSAATTG